MYPEQLNNNHAEDGVLYGLQGTKFYKEIEKSEAMTREDTTSKPDNKVKPFDEFAGLTDFEKTLADICIGWIGKEIGWKQYIKDNANVLLRIAFEKFNSVQDVPFEQKPAFLDTLEVKEIGNNLWKSANSNDLPEINREVVVLYQHYPLDVNEYSVGFAHRPPEYWDGKNIGTGVVTRYYPKKYGKGGWSSPDVKWWLDLDLPKMEE